MDINYSVSIIISLMKMIKSVAERLNGFDKPTVWTIMTPLAIETKSINLVLLGLFRDKDFHHGVLLNSF